MKLLIFSQFADGPNQTVLNIFSKQDYTAAFTVIKVGKSQRDEILAQVVSPSYWKLQLFITWFFWDGMYLKGALTVQIVSASHSSGLELSIELLIFWYRVKCVWFTGSTDPLARNHLRNSATTPKFWQQEPESNNACSGVKTFWWTPRADYAHSLSSCPLYTRSNITCA